MVADRRKELRKPGGVPPSQASSETVCHQESLRLRSSTQKLAHYVFWLPSPGPMARQPVSTPDATGLPGRQGPAPHLDRDHPCAACQPCPSLSANVRYCPTGYG